LTDGGEPDCFEEALESEEKPIKSLLQCKINFSQLRPRINNLTGQDEEQCVLNLL